MAAVLPEAPDSSEDIEAPVVAERIKFTYFRASLSEAIRNVRFDQRRFIVFKNGKPAAALVSMEDFRKLNAKT